VADFTHALIRKGLVEQGKAHRKPRGLRVTDAGLAELGLKKCGECGGRGWDEVL
jgi:hypothetical protein